MHEGFSPQDLSDLGDPIVCVAYDLEEALLALPSSDALNSVTPPVPTPCVLEKAAASVPQHWTGLVKPVEHPLLAYADNPEYIDWDGKKCHVILDKKGHIIGVLVCPPAPATAAMRAACDKMSFPPRNFPAPARGFAFGGGRQTVGNIKALSPANQAAMDKLLEDESIWRMATYPIPVFQSLCFPIYSDYHCTKQQLLQKNPHLCRTFPRSPFTAVTDLRLPPTWGPSPCLPPIRTPPTRPTACASLPLLSAFDPDQGGHLVCWDYNLLICFPLGCSVLIPSAVVTHSNTPIQAANGFRSDRQWAASATPADLVHQEEERATRCRTALQKFACWKDVKVKNFTGRARWEVWHEGDIADFSDLVEESEGEELPPQKKKRLA
ncbi:hypothetical protein B0H14DRAFT_2832086 [Mycena olivaceomarginata]|nr:hypothetical protein B0H14DRAFT_2832086 [Mycena olivaceomarginata]